MRKRPLDLTAIAVLFICVGVGSAAHGVVRFAGDRRLPDVVEVAASALLAVCAGAYLLGGRGWARWLCALWLAFHVVLSLFHSGARLAVHAALFVAISILLFRPAAVAYFRRGRTDA
ncbi:MAG TPA: hypothetical protein VFY93_02005 [Planctomycetota bacterium]|nr:hypothetical protein [Planctomycetota bacterium]